MPAKSGKQYRLFAGAAHNPAFAKKVGISQSVAEEFVHKTPSSDRSRWSRKKKGLSESYK